MVFNSTFNNISVISWQSVLLLKETGIPGENLVSVFYKFNNMNVFVFNYWENMFKTIVSPK